MLAVLEDLLDRSQSAQRKKGEAQLSMLMPSVTERDEDYPEIDEFPENQLIAFEKETIGFYISRHPLSRYEEEIRKYTGEDTSTLSGLPNGAETKICGLVSGLKEIVTKKGDRMAFLNLEDMKGFVEVILFPEVYKAALPCLRGGDPIIVRGTIDQSEDHIKIKGMDVCSLSEPSASPRKVVHLRIALSSLTKSNLADLREMIMANKGFCKVHLHLVDGENRETVIALSEDYSVDPSQNFQHHMRHLFQSSSLSFE
jgi:DNA polymerase-3 subunit alpha